MTLRTKTLSAVSALLVGTAGFVFAQDTLTEQPADQQVLTQPATDEAQPADPNEATDPLEPGERAEASAEDAEDAEAPEAAEAQDEPAVTVNDGAEAETATEEAAEDSAAAETPEEAAEDDTAADAAPAETVAEEQASEELPADESADQPEAEEVNQDAEAPAADDMAVEESAAEEAAPAGDAAETAEEEVSAEEPTVAEGETTEEADASAEEAMAEEGMAEEGEGEEAEEGEEGGHIQDIAFSFEGPFGKYDQFQLQRGLQVYTEVCSACHGLKQVPIRTLSDEGGPALPEDQVRAYAENMTIIDAETGEERPRLPTDHFPTVTGEGMGPDLSLMAKARAGFHGPYGTGLNQLFKGIGGPEYIHALMVDYTGEEIEQAGTVLYENTAFSSGYIGMPKPLSDDLVTYEDGTPATVDQMSRDVAAFLMWTAEPRMMDRKQVGLVSVIFLIVLAALLFYTNKRIWAPHKGKH